MACSCTAAEGRLKQLNSAPYVRSANWMHRGSYRLSHPLMWAGTENGWSAGTAAELDFVACPQLMPCSKEMLIRTQTLLLVFLRQQFSENFTNKNPVECYNNTNKLNRTASPSQTIIVFLCEKTVEPNIDRECASKLFTFFDFCFEYQREALQSFAPCLIFVTQGTQALYNIWSSYSTYVT